MKRVNYALFLFFTLAFLVVLGVQTQALCYQEQANENANGCGLSTGSYSIDSSTEVTTVTSTYSAYYFGRPIYIQARLGTASTDNYSVPSTCAYTDTFKVRMTTSKQEGAPYNTYSKLECYNGTDYDQIYYETSALMDYKTTYEEFNQSYDGDFSTGLVKGVNRQVGRACNTPVAACIWEEGVWWNDSTGKPVQNNIYDSISLNENMNARQNKYNYFIYDNIVISEKSTRNVNYVSVNFTSAIYPSSVISYKSQGYNFSVVWSVAGVIDSKMINVTNSSGSIIQSNSSTTGSSQTVQYLDFPIGSYTYNMWANTTTGTERSLSESFSITDQTPPIYNSVSLTASIYTTSAQTISVNVTDNETSVSSVYFTITDPNGNVQTQYQNVSTTQSGGLWTKAYSAGTFGIVGTWNVSNVYAVDSNNNKVYALPSGGEFVVGIAPVVVPTGGGGGGSPDVEQVVVGVNATFRITPRENVDIITDDGGSFNITVSVLSTSSNAPHVKAVITDSCNIYKGGFVETAPGSTTAFYSKTSAVYRIEPFKTLPMTFEFTLGHGFKTESCSEVISIVGVDGSEQKVNLRIWTSGVVGGLKRVATLLYYPISFDETTDKATFITPQYLAVFPSVTTFKIPFMGLLLFVFVFLAYRYLLYSVVKDFRNSNRRAMLFYVSSGLAIMTMALFYAPQSWEFFVSNKFIGYLVVISVLGIIVLTFRLPKKRF